MNSRVRNVVALGIGSAPGLLLSFEVLLLLPAREADTFLIGIAIALLVVGLNAGTYEASMVASFGRLLVEGGRPDLPSAMAAVRRAVRQCLPVALLVSPGLLLVLTLVGATRFSFAEACLMLFPLWLAPIASSATSVWSAMLTAHGRLRPVFLAVALRGGPTLVVLLLFRNIQILAITYLAGEALRYVVLRRVADGLLVPGPRASGAATLTLPSMREWLLQAASMAVSQTATISNKLFLGLGRAGAIAVGDTADKIFFAFNQVSLSAIVLPSVARLPGLFVAPERADRRAALGREARHVALLAVGLTVAGLLVVGGILLTVHGLPPKLQTALTWSLVVVSSLPAATINGWSSRVILLTRETSWLPRISVAAIVFNIAVNLLLLPAGISILVPVVALLSSTLAGAMSLTVALRKGPDFSLQAAEAPLVR